MMLVFVLILTCDAVSLSSRALPSGANEAKKVVGNSVGNIHVINGKKWSYGKRYAAHADEDSWSGSNYVKKTHLNARRDHKSGDANFNLEQTGKLDSAGVQATLSHAEVYSHQNITEANQGVLSPKKLNSLNRTVNFDVEGEADSSKTRATDSLSDVHDLEFKVDLTAVNNDTLRRGGKVHDHGRKFTHDVSGERDFTYSKGSTAEWDAAEAAGHNLYEAQTNDADWDTVRDNEVAAVVADNKVVSFRPGVTGGFGASGNAAGRRINYGLWDNTLAVGEDGQAGDSAGDANYDISVLDYLRSQAKATAPLCTATDVGTPGSRVMSHADPAAFGDSTSSVVFATGVSVWEGTKGCRYQCRAGVAEASVVQQIAPTGQNVVGPASTGCTPINGQPPGSGANSAAAAPCGKCTHFT